MNDYLRDVLSQPASLRAALAYYDREGYAHEMKKLAQARFERVVFAGMGSSHYCNFGAAIHLAQRGVTALVRSAGQLMQYDRGLIDGKTLVVMVSQSGESGEVVKLLETLPPSAKLVAITNNPESTLGKRGDVTFLLHVDAEEAVSSRTYLASWILASMVAQGLTGDLDDSFRRGVDSAIDLLGSFLKGADAASERMRVFLPHPPCVSLMGKGYSYSTAFSGALFTSELAKYPAMGFDTGEFRHGPFEMVERGFGALVFAPSGVSHESNCRMAADIVAHEGKAILVTNKPPSQNAGNLLVVEYGAIGEEFSPLVDIAAAQLFANTLAESKNIEIGKFRWGTKVTTTL